MTGRNNKKWFSLGGLTVCLSIWLFCGDITKPEFGIKPAVGNEKQIFHSDTQDVGLPFAFWIEASGSTPLSFQWYKEDTAIAGATKDSLLFSPLSYSDSGHYYCIVTNDIGSDTSHTDSIVFSNIDVHGPIITLIEPSVNTSSVTDSVLTVSIVVTDTSDIDSVLIDGKKIVSTDTIYTTLCTLSVGVDTIRILAFDASALHNSTPFNLIVTFNPLSVPYTITFDKNDTAATGTMSDQTISSGLSNPLSLNSFSKTGWFFAGWATTPNGAVVYGDGASYTMGTANVVLYAVWTQNPSYTITFDKNDTAATGTMPAQNIISGVTVALSTNSFLKTGWFFAGWSATPTGAVVYTDGAAYTMATANITLYAQWTEVPTYTITFDKNDGNATGTMSPQSVASGTTVPLSTNSYAKTGATFTGWSTTATGIVTYSDGVNFTMGTANVTLYAVWTQNASFTITFSKNDAGATGTTATQSIVSGITAALTLNGYSKAGWSFAGWATTATGAVVYTDGADYTMGTANVILYAKWTQNASHTITFDKNNGAATGSMSVQSIVSGTTATLLTNGFSNVGYSFAGWSTTPAGAVEYAGGASYTMGDTNVTLYAQWTQNPSFSVTFDKNDAGAAGSMTVQSMVSGTTAPLTTNAFTKTGYTFAGWAITPTGAVAYADGANYTIGTTNVTLYAKWTIIIYQLSLATGTGGSITTPTTSSVMVNYNAATTITASANTQYAFQKWTITAGTASITDSMSASTTVRLTSGNATVKANFRQLTCSWAEAHNTGSSTNNLFSIAAKGDTIFLGPQKFGIIRSVNNGTNWNTVGGTSSYTYAMSVLNGNIYAGQGNISPGIFRSVNNGSNWTNVQATGSDVHSFCSKGDTLYAGTNAGVFISKNNGVDWVADIANSAWSYGTINTLVRNGSFLFAGTSGGLYYSTSSDYYWHAGSTLSFNEFALIGSTLFAGTSTGVYKYDNNGGTWTAVNNGLTSTSVNTLVASGTYLFAGTNNGVFLSTDNGSNWFPVNTNLPANTYVYGLAVGSSALFFRSGLSVYKSDLP